MENGKLKIENVKPGTMERGKYLARRHEDTKEKPESANERADVRVHSLTPCIIFISFMNFMVRMAVLCALASSCEKWFRGCPNCPNCPNCWLKIKSGCVQRLSKVSEWTDNWKWKVQNMGIYHRGHGGHGGKTGVSEWTRRCPRSFADSSIIFISFMNFMVRMAVLCALASSCEKWF